MHLQHVPYPRIELYIISTSVELILHYNNNQCAKYSHSEYDIGLEL